MKGVGIALGCGAVIVIMVIIGVFVYFGQVNKLVRMEEEVSSQWSQVDNQLKRRNDLIPNLQEVVKGYSKHEQEIFDKLTEARKAYGAAKTPEDKMKIGNEIGSTLSRLLVIVESNPQPQAAGVFRDFMVSLESTENRIGTERGRYNETVKLFNQAIKTFPGSYFAGMRGLKEKQYYEVPETEKATPKVKF